MTIYVDDDKKKKGARRKPRTDQSSSAEKSEPAPKRAAPPPVRTAGGVVVDFRAVSSQKGGTVAKVAGNRGAGGGGNSGGGQRPSSPRHRKGGGDLNLTLVFHLSGKLRAELSGILNRLLDGLRDRFDHGQMPSESVLTATPDYRNDSDQLGRFLEACVRPAKGCRVQSSVMHETFVAWAKANGAAEWTNKGMTSALEERGYQKKHSGAVWWVDVKLIRGASDLADDDGRASKNRVVSQSRGKRRQK